MRAPGFNSDISFCGTQSVQQICREMGNDASTIRFQRIGSWPADPATSGSCCGSACVVTNFCASPSKGTGLYLNLVSMARSGAAGGQGHTVNTLSASG